MQWFPNIGLNNYLRQLRLYRHLNKNYSKWKLLILIPGLTIAVTLALLFVTIPIVMFFLQKDIQEGFSYPLDLNNFPEVVNQFRLGILDESSISPINLKYSTIPFLRNAINPIDIENPVGLLIVVKSATRNYKKRDAVRKSWGSPDYLKKTALSPNLPTKLVFICGIPSDFVQDQELFLNEGNQNDIVLAEFDDNYFNNTYKSILALKWATTEFPSDYQYLLLIDDDMFVNLENMIAFLQYLPSRKIYKNVGSTSSIPFLTLDAPLSDDDQKNSEDGQLVAKSLYMGTVYESASPIRWNIWGLGIFPFVDKKWYVPLDDYPFNKYPPYVPGSSMLLSKTTVTDLYHASLFVKHFWIDDAYLGILAYKMKVIPLHNPNFISQYYGLNLVDESTFGDVITLHGFDCPGQLLKLFYTRSLIDARQYSC